VETLRARNWASERFACRVAGTRRTTQRHSGTVVDLEEARLRRRLREFAAEHSRLCLALRVGRRRKARDVVAVLEEVTSISPAPAFIRSDNGPEFNCFAEESSQPCGYAHTLLRWCENSGTTAATIEPGSPWQKGFADSFNGRFRDEFLNTELFSTVAEAQALANRWLWEYRISGRIRPSRGVRPWRQLKQLPHDHPLSFGLDQ
jgi:transposase InsO family protein